MELYEAGMRLYMMLGTRRQTAHLAQTEYSELNVLPASNLQSYMDCVTHIQDVTP